MPTTPPSLTPAPTPYPQRSDRATFSTRVDAFVTWLVAAIAQLAALAANVYANASEVFTNANAAASSAAAAAASSLSANAAAGAQMWVSGNSYGIATGQTNTAWSPTNYLTYRKITALSVSTTDPASDTTNWVLAFPNYVPSINPKALSQAIWLTESTGVASVVFPYSANTDFGYGNFTLHVSVALNAWTYPYLLTKYESATKRMGVALSDIALTLYIYDTGKTTVACVSSLILSADALAGRKLTVSVVRETETVAGSCTFYLEGIQFGNVVNIPAAGVGLLASASNTSALTALNYYSSSTGRWEGAVYGVCAYNRAMTASGISLLARNGVGYADVGAAETNLVTSWTNDPTYPFETFTTSGADITSAINSTTLGIAYSNSFQLTAGKKYKFYAVVAGSDFTGGCILAVNTAQYQTGTNEGNLSVYQAGVYQLEYTATVSGTHYFTFRSHVYGATPNMYLSGVYNKRVGCTAQYDSDGIQASGQWLDSSGNANHGAMPASGWSLLQRQEASKYVWSTAITGDTTLTSIVPAGYELEKIVFKNSTTNAVSVRLGTTTGGVDVFGLTALNISTTLGGFKTITCNQGFSLTAAQTLYLSSTAWGGASLTATLFFRKI